LILADDKFFVFLHIKKILCVSKKSNFLKKKQNNSSVPLNRPVWKTAGSPVFPVHAGFHWFNCMSGSAIRPDWLPSDSQFNQFDRPVRFLKQDS
jgi:hypothetical protein